MFNAAAETASVLVQQELTATQKKRKLLLGDVYLGLQNGNFGTALAGWHDHGSISAIDVSSGKRVWKFTTPEPERGGVTTTASGLGFAGGGDGVLRAFDLKTGKVLWTFQTGNPIASGATVFAHDGKEYVAITVGGTPTSSNGGTVSQLQVFSLPRNSDRAAPSRTTQNGATVATPRVAAAAADPPARHLARVLRGGRRAHRDRRRRADAQALAGELPNLSTVTGRVLLGRRPVEGAVVAVDRYRLPQRTGPRGGFSYPVDSTLARRHPIRVIDASRAKVAGRPLTAAERQQLLAASGGISVGYRIADLHASKAVRRKRARHGSRRTRRRRAGARGRAAELPPRGHDHRRGRRAGQRRDGRLTHPDRDFWTFSQPSNAKGHYVSFFSASDEEGSDPVSLSVQVASGRKSRTPPGRRRRASDDCASATMNVKLPAAGTVFANPTTSAEAGAFYRGLLVGVSSANGVGPSAGSALARRATGASRYCSRRASVARRSCISGRATRHLLADTGCTRVGCRPQRLAFGPAGARPARRRAPLRQALTVRRFAFRRMILRVERSTLRSKDP